MRHAIGSRGFTVLPLGTRLLSLVGALCVAGCTESHVVDDGVIRECSPVALYELEHDADADVTRSRLRTEADCDFTPCELSVIVGADVLSCTTVGCVEGHPRLLGGCDAGP